MKEIDTFSDKGQIICPYCGHIHDRHDFELPDKMEFDRILCKCGNCDSKFYLGQTVTIYNETYKVSRNDMTTENKQEVKNLYNQGLNPEDIAEELGLDECEVMDYCAELLEEQQ